MAKRTPAEWKKEGEELRKKFVDAKKNDQNFGLVIGKEGMVLEISKTKPADKMYKSAKESKNGTPKGIQGVMSVNGTVIQFKYEGTEKDLPGGIETKWKQYVTQSKVTGFKAEFVPSIAEEDKNKAKEDSGAETEESAMKKAAASAADSEAADGDSEDGADDGALKKKLNQDLDKIEAVFKVNYEGLDEKTVEELKGALKAIRGTINSGDLTGAQNSMNKLKLLTGVGPETPAKPGMLKLPKKGGKKDELSPEEAKNIKKQLTKAMAQMKPDLQKTVMAADKPEQAELQKIIKSFTKAMKKDEILEAEEHYSSIKDKVDAFLEAQKNLEKATQTASAQPAGMSEEKKAERSGKLGDLKKRVEAMLAEIEE